MRHARRITLLGAAAAVLALALGAGPAWSAAPANDTFAGATTITLPYTSGPVDTTEATMGPDDTAVGTACGIGSSPAVDSPYSNSVWYAFTPTADAVAKIDTSASNYSVAGAVVTGSPDAFSSVSCFIGRSTFPIQAGTTYYVDLLAYNSPGGGDLEFSIVTGQAPTATFAVTGGAFTAPAGNATIAGTVTCTAGANFYASGSVTQTIGHGATVQGYFGTELVCTGSRQQWTADVQNVNGGRFTGGKVDVSTFYEVYSDFGYVLDTNAATVVLKGK